MGAGAPQSQGRPGPGSRLQRGAPPGGPGTTRDRGHVSNRQLDSVAIAESSMWTAGLYSGSADTSCAPSS